jgi:Spy/CpxP family protein refolding chaperone
MKSSRMLILGIIALVLLVPVRAWSQRGPMSVEDQVKALTERLSLTKEQVEKATAILTVAQKDGQALRDSLGGDREAMRSAMMAQREKTDKKIGEILTPEQKKKYDEMMKERRERMRQRMPGMGGGPQ